MIKEPPHHLTRIVVVDMFVIRKEEDMAHKPGQTTLSIAHITFWLMVGTFFMFPYIGNFIIPTDELIFFRGVKTTNQIRCESYRESWRQNMVLGSLGQRSPSVMSLSK